MNKVILMGRLTRDPEIRWSQSAQPVAVARYTIAVNRQFKKEGQPDADFINCVAFGKSGEFAEKYFKKGQMVAVTGRLQISTLDDPSGQKKYFTDVVVEEQHFAESKQSFESRVGSESKPRQSSQADVSAPDMSGYMPVEEAVDDEDLPF